jgi:imidazolonepropionase-like amidohydrolase
MTSSGATRGVVLTNAHVFDGVAADLVEHANVVVDGGRIIEVTTTPVRTDSLETIDIGDRVLMPGLIDAHFHAYGISLDVSQFDHMPMSLLAHHGASNLRQALFRGFTTVRDAAGADYGLARAVDLGLIPGPRIFYSGKSLSQTGGHGDMRSLERIETCPCGYSGALSVVVDGEDEVRKAAREELRQGAHQIKIHVSGGVLSPSDPLWMPQFSDAEIKAAVEEAATRRTYVMAHAHTTDAAARCVRLGVRSIEHGTFIDTPTARLIAASDAFVVPTLAVSDLAGRFGKDAGLPKQSLAKLEGIQREALESYSRCLQAGVKLGFGTDLLGRLHSFQTAEFVLRRQVDSSIDILRSATSINALLLNRPQELGSIVPGAHADLLVVDGNPLDDIALLNRPHETLLLIMKDGIVYKNALGNR